MGYIGSCAGGSVYYEDGTVRVGSTNVAIFGCKDRQDAIERARKNLKDFKGLKPKKERKA